LGNAFEGGLVGVGLGKRAGVGDRRGRIVVVWIEGAGDVEDVDGAVQREVPQPSHRLHGFGAIPIDLRHEPG
jgi:hypothetical protein